MGRKPFHIKPDVQNLDCDFYVFQDTKYVVQQELGFYTGKKAG
jgi:selenocysteine lyase/cysteine desulfurase